MEADEATFSCTDLKHLADNPKQPIIWEQWCGIAQRGSPRTLLLKRLTPQTSARRAPGPGAIRRWSGVLYTGWRHRPPHGRRQVVQAESEWRSPRPCAPLQKASKGQRQMGVENAYLCEDCHP